MDYQENLFTATRLKLLLMFHSKWSCYSWYRYIKTRSHKLTVRNSFTLDSRHHESLTRNGNDITCIRNRDGSIPSCHAGNAAVTICNNVWAPRKIIFASVCDCNLILATENRPFNREYYATNVVINIKWIVFRPIDRPFIFVIEIIALWIEISKIRLSHEDIFFAHITNVDSITEKYHFNFKHNLV